MALSSALFSGISGLSNLGNAMQIIGDNIANVNTIGFKASSFTFQDLLSQEMNTRSGTAQVGRGTAVSTIYATFEQGSFESTGNTTDLAIGGDGFFSVQDSSSDSTYYTRAGNFSFDKDGYLVNPEGYIVQGWEVDSAGDTLGSVNDIALTSFTSNPDSTDDISIITNLDKDATSNTAILSSRWDGTADVPMDAVNYEYQTTVKAYDSLGSTHDVTVYYDKINGSDWEYIVTCNPDEDRRTGFEGTQSAGLLSRGQVSFNDSSGAITSIEMSSLTGTTNGTGQSVLPSGGTYGGTAAPTINNAGTLVSDDTVTLTWDSASSTFDAIGFASGGYGGASILSSSSTQVEVDLNGDSSIDLTIDLSEAPDADNETIAFAITGSTDWTEQTAADMNTAGYFQFNADFLGGTGTAQDIAFDIGTRWDGTAFANDSLSSTQYATSSTTIYQSSDGYGPGDLQGVDVDVSGVITGVYSNGEVLPLYQIALAKFQSLQGLYKEGGNLYRETRASGEAITGQPGMNGLGTIAPNSLEQSNVDMATEFVKMITTQRGFQANSKIITVTDQMLSDLINLKR